MGLRFPRRDRSALYFPTGHVHDGEVHPRAQFDHTLYAQVPADVARHLDWQRSAVSAGAADLACDPVGLDPGRPIHGRHLTGALANTDAWLRAPDPAAATTTRGPLHRAWVRAPRLVTDLPDDGGRRVRAPRALATALATVADDLPALVAAHADAWGLAPLHDDTPIVAQAPTVALPAVGPCAVAFDVGGNRAWSGICPTVVLGFAQRPDAARRETIERELTERLRVRRARRGP